MMRIPAISLVLAVSSAMLYIAFGPASDLLVYQRVAVSTGEVGRLVSAHFIHSDGAHLAWNLMALLILGGLLERREGAATLLIYMLVGVLSVNLFVVWYSGLSAYCGLSGVLNTLLVGVLVSLFRTPHLRTLALGVGLAAVLKISLELAANHALLTHTAWPGVPQAHLYGFIGGVLIASLRWRLSRDRMVDPRDI